MAFSKAHFVKFIGLRASTAPAKFAHPAGAAVGHLRGANVAVAQVRGLLAASAYSFLSEARRSSEKAGILVLSAAFSDLVELGGVAAEDQLLGGTVGIAERRKAVFLLHVLREFRAGAALRSATAVSRTTPSQYPT